MPPIPAGDFHLAMPIFLSLPSPPPSLLHNRRGVLRPWTIAMQLPFTDKCRHVGATVLLISFFFAGAQLSISAYAEDAPPADKPGGVSVEIPQSPPLIPVLIGYIREVT